MIGDFDIKCAPIILLYHDNFYGVNDIFTFTWRLLD